MPQALIDRHTLRLLAAVLNHLHKELIVECTGCRCERIPQGFHQQGEKALDADPC